MGQGGHCPETLFRGAQVTGKLRNEFLSDMDNHSFVVVKHLNGSCSASTSFVQHLKPAPLISFIIALMSKTDLSRESRGVFSFTSIIEQKPHKYAGKAFRKVSCVCARTAKYQ